MATGGGALALLLFGCGGQDTPLSDTQDAQVMADAYVGGGGVANNRDGTAPDFDIVIDAAVLDVALDQAEDGANSTQDGPAQDGPAPTAVRRWTVGSAALDFGWAVIGHQGLTKSIEIRNSGVVFIEGLKVALAGTASAAFEILPETNCADRLAPEASCKIVVRYVPAAEAIHEASLRIEALELPEVVRQLKGQSVKLGVLQVVPAEVEFRNVAPGQLRGRGVRIDNTTAQPLTLISRLDGDDKDSFRFSRLNCATVAAHSTCDVLVVFAPDVAGDYEATLAIGTETQGWAVVPLRGEVIDSQLKLTPGMLDFGTVLRKSSPSMRVTLTVSDLPVGVTTGKIVLETAAGLALADDACSMKDLVNGDSCSFSVRASQKGPEGLFASTVWAKAPQVRPAALKVVGTFSSGPPVDFLVGHWTFDRTLNDSSGNGLHAEAVEGSDRFSPAVSPIFVPGKVDFALDLSTRWGRVANSPKFDAIAENDEYSITLWVRPGGGADPLSYISFPSSGGSPHFRLGEDEGHWTTSMSFWELKSKKKRHHGWHHIAVTYDEVDLRLYIDGELDGSLSLGLKLDPDATPILFGADLRQDNGIHGRAEGQLDDIRIYSRHLSEAEVKADMMR